MEAQKKITKFQTTKRAIVDSETKSIIQCLTASVKVNKDRTYHCWWCTLSIDESPVGCPFKRQANALYATDGIFCSFNCVKAYILDNVVKDSKFKDSARLLSLMAMENQSIEKPVNIVPSIHWRFLIQYGGHLTPDQYRQMQNRVTYIEKGIIHMHPIVTLFEEVETF